MISLGYEVRGTGYGGARFYWIFFDEIEEGEEEVDR